MSTQSCFFGTEVLIIISFQILLLSLNACSPAPNRNIKDYLGFPLPAKATNINFYKSARSTDYVKPYNVYIKFTLNRTSVDTLIKNLGLVSNQSDFRKLLCLENDYLFNKKIWKLVTNDPIESTERFKKDQGWWDPTGKSLLLYASFYKMDGKDKIVHCYS